MIDRVASLHGALDGLCIDDVAQDHVGLRDLDALGFEDAADFVRITHEQSYLMARLDEAPHRMRAGESRAARHHHSHAASTPNFVFDSMPLGR